MSTQLPLPLQLSDTLAFENFYPGPNREPALYLRASCTGPADAVCYLWGPAAVGKSHLLHAVCQLSSRSGASAAYLPLAGAHPATSPERLLGMESMGHVCLDDLHRICGQAPWERALLSLLRAARSTGTRLVLSGDRPLARLTVRQAALRRMLAGALVFWLQPLGLQEQIWAVQMRARRRGVKLPEDVARYLIRHYARDLGDLFGALEALDYASLAAKRRLTIPFIRSVLSSADGRQTPRRP